MNLNQSLYEIQNTVHQVDTKQLIQEYCRSISYGSAVLIVIGMIMWLMQPALEKFLKKKLEDPNCEIKIDYKSIMMIYKWIGLGIMALSLYGIFFV